MALTDRATGTWTIDTSRTVITASGGSEQQVSGEVEIKGRTVPLVFTVSKLDVGEDSASFELETTLDRFSVGVDKSPAFVIGRDIDVQVTVGANKTS